MGSARPVQLSGEKTKAGMPGSYSGGSTMLWEFISWFPSAFFSFLFLSIFFFLQPFLYDCGYGDYDLQ